MLKAFSPFSQPTISREGIDAVRQVLESGWVTIGSSCVEFEKRFSDFCGAAGMHLLLEYFGTEPGDEVITPFMTWVSTANDCIPMSTMKKMSLLSVVMCKTENYTKREKYSFLTQFLN